MGLTKDIRITNGKDFDMKRWQVLRNGLLIGAVVLLVSIVGLVGCKVKPKNEVPQDGWEIHYIPPTHEVPYRTHEGVI